MGTTRRALLLALGLTGDRGHAGRPPGPMRCSRPISVPLAPNGVLSQLENGRPAGVGPEFFRLIEQQGGIRFQVSVLPRGQVIRSFFETFEADILFPASRNLTRETFAHFVPNVLSRPTLITLPDLKDPPHSITALREAPQLRGAVVRSYHYGTTYDELIKALAADQRLDQVRDVTTVLRMLLAGRVHFSIMAPSIIWGERQSLAVGQHGQPLR